MAQEAPQAALHQRWAVELPSPRAPSEAEETSAGGVHKPSTAPGPSVLRESCPCAVPSKSLLSSSPALS